MSLAAGSLAPERARGDGVPDPFARVARGDAPGALQRVLRRLPEAAPAILDRGWAGLAADHLHHALALKPRSKKLAAGREEEALLEARGLEAQGDRAGAARALATFGAGHRDALDARRAWASALLLARRRGDAKEVADEALARE